MEFEKFDRFSDEQLQRIANGKSKGYSRNDIDTVRSVLEWRSAQSGVRTCKQCGNPLEGDVCPICGLHVNNEQPVHAKAKGGLRVWMWIIIVVGIIGACLALYYAAALHNIYSLLFIASFILTVISIFGAFRLLNGFKNGFYIICACEVISVCMNLIVLKFSSYSFLVMGNLASLLIIWLFARNQWNSFK
jgi:Recombinational DNA repair protein (RecF pathway)